MLASHRNRKFVNLSSPARSFETVLMALLFSRSRFRRSHAIHIARLAIVLLASLSVGCGESTTGPDGSAATPSIVQIYGGDQQQAPAGTALATPLVVEVLGAKGSRSVARR